jgi:heme A synthase
MKKIIVATMALGMMVSAANASMSYECWVYKNGKPMWMTHVSADSKSQAESKAVVKFRDLGRKGDYIKCK